MSEADRPRSRRDRHRPTSTPRSTTLVGELGGTIFSGGDGYGFRWVQVRLGDARGGHDRRAARRVGARAERLPRPVPRAARCRAAPPHVQGAGPRGDARARAAPRASRRSASTSRPEWKEAFLQPREAHGTVVQLAQAHRSAPGRRGARRHAEPTDRSASRGGGRRRAAPRGRARRAPARRARRRRRCRRRSASSPACSRAGRRPRTRPAVELAWPGGGRIRLEPTPTAPGFVRLDADRRRRRVDRQRRAGRARSSSPDPRRSGPAAASSPTISSTVSRTARSASESGAFLGETSASRRGGRSAIAKVAQPVELRRDRGLGQDRRRRRPRRRGRR